MAHRFLSLAFSQRDATYPAILKKAEDHEKVKDFFGRNGKYQRLIALKNKYDPTNMFRLNQNIKPMG
ncbi:MAG: BBE domain-containing protein [Actinomycetota bacterium]|nr:BBE domain-containing protein [Actinomycetota bacterium]